jgi:hypothetical protein
MQRTRLILAPIPAGGAPAAMGRWAWTRFVAFELALWAALYGCYLAVRGVTIGSPDEAVRHAWDVVDLERTVGLFHEAAFQSVLGPLERLLSAYYMLGFGPLLLVVGVWLGLRDRAGYRAFRTALMVSIALATVVFVLFPTAPPRLVDGLGIEDSVGLSSHDTGSFLGIRFNPYAAVPSMHVGWSLLVAVFGFRAARRRLLKAFFAVHPALMAVTVTGTGNHYFFDSLAGIVVAVLTLTLTRTHRRRRYPRPQAVPAAAPVWEPAHALERRAA